MVSALPRLLCRSDCEPSRPPGPSSKLGQGKKGVREGDVDRGEKGASQWDQSPGLAQSPEAEPNRFKMICALLRPVTAVVPGCTSNRLFTLWDRTEKLYLQNIPFPTATWLHRNWLMPALISEPLDPGRKSTEKWPILSYILYHTNILNDY